MKKLLAIMLAAVMALSIAGCAAPAAQETVTAEETAAPQETEAAEETVAPQEAASELSATVQQLYADFDAAMEKQLGARRSRNIPDQRFLGKHEGLLRGGGQGNGHSHRRADRHYRGRYGFPA